MLPILIVFLGLWAANSWIKDREVGTFGIIIASFGVLGEAYQFTTQLVI